MTFLCPEIATFTNMPVPFLFSRIMMSGLLLETVLSVRTCCFLNLVNLTLLLVLIYLLLLLLLLLRALSDKVSYYNEIITQFQCIILKLKHCISSTFRSFTDSPQEGHVSIIT